MTQASKTPDLSLGVTMAGLYRCVLNEGTDREVDTGWFPNLITNGGLDRLGSEMYEGLDVFKYASIGTGTTLPANTDSSLQAYIADTLDSTLDGGANYGAPTYSGYRQVHHTYAQGAVVGNMAEVGLGWEPGGISLWSRARILDNAGIPTILTVTAVDQITVYYKIVAIPVITDISGTVTLSGTTHAYTGRLAYAASFFYTGILSIGGLMAYTTVINPLNTYPATSVLGAITGFPSGQPVYGGFTSSANYTPGSRYRDSTIEFPPGYAVHPGGIGAIVFGSDNGGMGFQYSFTPPIPKDDTMVMSLVARVSWDRA